MNSNKDPEFQKKVKKEISRLRRSFLGIFFVLGIFIVCFIGFYVWSNKPIPEVQKKTASQKLLKPKLTDPDEFLLKNLDQFKDVVANALEGDDESQFVLGNVFLKGIGVKRNFKIAEKWLLASANNGNVEAMNNLGYLYKLENNIPQSMLWYRHASEKGNADAQLNLAVLLNENGEGNEKEIVSLLQKSILDDPDMKAHFYLAWVYLNDDDESNDEEGVKLMHEAAYFGYPQAQYVMGQILEEGRFVPENHKESQMWYRKAANSGFAQAFKKLDRKKAR